jgi:membrane protease YdiL (CAAX protease family)
VAPLSSFFGPVRSNMTVLSKSESAGLFLAGSLGSLLCGAMVALMSHVGAVGAKPLAELLVALVLMKLYPEVNIVRWSSRLFLLLCAIGAALALAWVAIFAWGNTQFFDIANASVIALVVGCSSAVLTAPIFEEKVVRHLLLQGAVGIIGRWWASLFVSAVFALVHTGAMIWAFAVSMVLCWFALAKGFSSAQRAVVHGVVNAIIMLWYFTRGFGLAG